jgi:hypothetical protein
LLFFPEILLCYLFTISPSFFRLAQALKILQDQLKDEDTQKIIAQNKHLLNIKKYEEKQKQIMAHQSKELAEKEAKNTDLFLKVCSKTFKLHLINASRDSFLFRF